MGVSTNAPPSWRRTLLPTAIAPVVLIILLGALLGWLGLRTVDAARWVDHTLDVLRHANALDAHLNTMEAGQRGFLITRDRAFAAPLERARPRASAELDTLHVLVADNPPQQARVDALRRLQAAWLTNAELEMRLAASSDPRFLATFTSGRGAHMMEQLRREIETFRLEERRLLAEREARVRRDALAAGGTGLAGLVLLVAFQLTVGRRQRRLFGSLYARLAEHSLLLDAAHDAIIVRDAETNEITLWNQGAERLYGYTPEEALGKPTHELLVTWMPAEPEAIAEQLRQSGRWEGELRQQAHDGRALSLEARWTYHVEANGRAVVLENNHDVTATRHAQHELDRQRELGRQMEREAYEQADALKDQFVAAISHELRTPINAITGFGSLLEDEMFGPLAPDQHKYLRRMMAMAENLLVLVNDLLDATRVRTGRFSIDVDVLEPAPLLTEVTERLAPLAEQKGQTLTFAPVAALGCVRADAQRITQVLTNLIGNAVKFTPDHGTITLRARAEAGHVRIEVEDTGPGITPADLPRLFKPFSQLDTDPDRRNQGTGLGLSISKAIVEAHGGAIGVDSAPGRGSTFWFTLPTA